MAIDIDYGIQYREFHEDNDEYFEGRVRVELSRVTPFLSEQRNGEALDIGCGMGFTMGALQRLGFEAVYGVDIDRSQIEASRRRGLAVEQITTVKSYLDDFPGRFELITMFDVLEHIPVEQQIPTARSIYRALAPGGRLIVQVPNANSIGAFRWRYNDFTHVCSYTEQSLRPVLVSGGFEQVHIPPLGNTVARPSLRPHRLFSKGTREQLLRWTVRRLWRLVLYAEFGDTALKIPLDLNLIAIADKPA